MVTIPEYILLDHIKKALIFIRKDFEAQQDKQNSFLYRNLFGQAIERYDLAVQAEQVFITNDETNTRFLEVHLMFNMEREGLPTIHITLPSEQTQTGGNGMGSDEGYQDDIEAETQNIPVYTRRFQSTYNIVITSDNSNEVVMIYHIVRALLIGLIPSISLAGLENMNFGGQDVQLYQGMANKGMYVRAITATLQYETSAPSLFGKNLVNDLTATGKLING